jgi:exonuclease III
MTVLSLNTWGGRAGKELLLSFLAARGGSVDVFCLQEVWAAPYMHLEGRSAGGRALTNDQILIYGLEKISAALPDHTPFFRPHHGDFYGLLMMVRKTLPVVEEGEVFVYKHKGYEPEGDVGNHARNIQHVTVHTDEGPLTVMNFHGLWTNVGPGKWKNDNPERLEQSEKILAFTKELRNPLVLCGDFNLLPTTESIKKFEDAGLRNLIKEFGITSTRTRFYEKDGKFADYAFISNDLTLKHFSVLPDEVSDHAPLLIEIE